jgi:DNA-binding beta-propeller fold protein YncE
MSRITALRRAFALVLAAVLLLAPVAWALGELSQKPGAAGCVSETGNGGACGDGTALDGARDVAASPDGEHVYVASGASGAVAIFDRDPTTGALTQKPGTAGCISEDGTGGLCQNGTALQGPSGVVASPDGRGVYVASDVSDAVGVFDRDPATGALTQKPGSAGCISEDGSGGACQNGTGLNGADSVAVSADGKNVYAVSPSSSALAVFDRDAATGALTQKPGSAGCISEDGSGGACQNGTALQGTFGVVASPDGKSVYVGSDTSGAVAVFERDPVTGALTQKPGTAGCVSDDGSGGACENGTALAGAARLTVSPEGTSVYVGSFDSGAVAVFDRDPASGALTQKPGTAGCVSETGSGGGCQDGTALSGITDVAASPDGESVYVASAQSDAVAVFDRDPATGALTQKPGSACVSEKGTGACQDGTALELAYGVATSPDGKSVYVAAIVSDAVAVFDRATPSPPPPPSPPRATGGGETGGGTGTRLAFGTKTLVTLALAARRIPAKGPVAVRVSNANGFQVTGKLSGQRTTKVAVPRKRPVKLKVQSFRVGAHAHTKVKLSLPRALRQLLKRTRQLSLRLTAKVKDPAGHARTVTKTIKPRLKERRKPSR